jgi:cinnamyl-alcohol dehydrogenase
LNGIIDTVSASHPILQLIGLLKTNGKLVMVGGVAKPLELPAFALLGGKHMKNIFIYTLTEWFMKKF